MTPRVYRASTTGWLSLSVAVVMALIGLSGIVVGFSRSEGVHVGSAVMGASILTAAIWLGWRGPTSAVRVEADCLVVRRTHRTRRFRWDQVEGAEVVSLHTWVPYRNLQIHLVDGRLVSVDDIGSLFVEPWRAPADLAAADINQMVAWWRDRRA